MLITNINGGSDGLMSDVDLVAKDGVLTYLDGWQDDDHSDVIFKEENIKIGVYNLIHIWRAEQRLSIRNDPFGQRQLFLYLSGGSFVITDNFWTPLKLINRYDIDWGRVEENIIALRPSIPYETYVRDLYVIPAGTVVNARWGAHAEVKFRHYAYMEQNESPGMNFESAVGETIDALDATMQLVRRKWPERQIVFGNSGGLDSRLIPYFAKRNGVEVSGYFIGEEHVKQLKSRSARSADLVAKLTGTDYRVLPYDYGNPADRINRDILVNPLGPANHFKNSGYGEYAGAMVLNAADSFVITNDSNKWMQYIKSGIKDDELFRNYMLRPTFRGLISTEISEYIKTFSDYFRVNVPLKDTFSTIRTLHQVYWNKVSPNGGFESLSRTGDFLFVYYPYLWYKSLSWQKDWFFDRKIQVGVFSKLDRRLRSIRTQKPLPLSRDVSNTSARRWIDDKFARLDYKFRRSGIDYARWEKGSWFREAERIFISRPSKNFDELLNKNNISLDRNCLAFQDYYDLTKLRYITALMESGDNPDSDIVQ